MTGRPIDRRTLLGASLVAGAVAALPAEAAAPARRAWPKGFLWGTATAGHQVEGNNVNADLWLAENVSPTIFPDRSGDACDGYHRYAEDAALAARLGFNCHRFSLEWSRIEPEPGIFSIAQLDHYARVLEACHAHGLSPFVTYSHFSQPRWFAARGGFEAADSAELFARFAARATARLGPLIHHAVTFNEPNLLDTVFWHRDPFGKTERGRAMNAAAAKACGSDRFVTVFTADPARATPNMLAAHRLAYQAIKAGPGDFPVGVSLSMADEQGIGAGNLATQRQHDSYDVWLEAAAASDFVGVQTYTRNRAGPVGPIPLSPDADRTQIGYEYYPPALGGTIRYAAIKTGKPVYVTENGVATEDDARRIAYIDGALTALRGCIADGIDVRGYIHWSLLDNYEWWFGYRPRFGLVAVDRTTFERTPKRSAHHLGMIARDTARA